MHLKIEKASTYDGRFPYFSQPLEIGCFSVGSDRSYCDDTHQLKYISMPQNMSHVSMDLNKGYADVIKRNRGKNEKIDFLLRWIVEHQEEIKKCFYDHKMSKLKMQFVCFRGLLTVICATLYENHEDWIICATKFKSVIYLCAFETEQDINRRDNMTERDKLMCSWGYKFEQYMSSDAVNSKPNTSVPVNEKEEYCSLMKGKLKDHTILYGAEIDAVDPAYFEVPDQDPSSMQRYIELKTSKIIVNDRVRRSFCRYKLLKWWLQSFLAGIPRIICGFRDDHGIVRKLENFDVKGIPKMAHGHWSPAACLNFCSQFLDFVKECALKDDPLVVYKFHFKPGSKITCEELECPSEYQILPDWYIENLTF